MSAEISTTYLADSHIHIADHGAGTSEVVFDRLNEERDGSIRCELVVSTTLPPKHGRLIGPVRLNLLSERTISSVANKIATRCDLADWYAIISTAASRSVERFREGNPLEAHEPRANLDREWLLPPFLEDSGWTVLYARKGSAKSYLAAAIALGVATGTPVFGTAPVITGPVAYLDWESTKREFDVRVTKLARSLGIGSGAPLYYRRSEGSLASSVPALARGFAKHDIAMAVIDSKSVAMSSNQFADATLEMNRAIRRLGVPVLLIDHMSKAAMKGDDPDMAFGSVHTGNAARMVWSVKPSWEPGRIVQYLRNTDANNGPKAPDMTVTFTFDGDEVWLSYAHPSQTWAQTPVSPAPVTRVPDPLPDPY